MTCKKFVYFNEVEVERTRGKNFKVFFTEADMILCVDSAEVQRISVEIKDEEEEMLAILLAYIEYVYQNTKVSAERIGRLDNDKIVETSKVLLKHFSVEELILILKQFKWHEICQIFNSEDPLREIDNRQ